MKRDTFEKYYRKQASNYDAFAEDGHKHEHAKTWLQSGTIDAWRHNRMYALIDPLLESNVELDWLTVGDGRFGKDAHYIQEHGADVLATNITDELLIGAVASGYIKRCKVENAEALTFADDCFDYVYCKESYHHFPRPMIALYEMLRVARKGVALIEPNDILVPATHLLSVTYGIKYLLRQLLGKPANNHSFETGGNYMYSVSRRELEKFALGMGLRCIAFCGLNDCYLEGVENETVSESSDLFNKVKKRIKRSDLLCSLGLKASDMLSVIIFNSSPDKRLREKLRVFGYTVVDLPVNPYQ